MVNLEDTIIKVTKLVLSYGNKHLKGVSGHIL